MAEDKVISAIALYRLVDKPNDYYVYYKRFGDYKGVHARFDTPAGANDFLKKLYRHVGYGFSFDNMTMKDFDKESWKSYFYIPENDEKTDKIFDFDKNFRRCYIFDLKTIKEAHKKIFGKPMGLNKIFVHDKLKYRLEQSGFDTKEIARRFSILAIIACCVGGCSVIVHSTRREIETAKKEAQKNINEYEAAKTINLADSIQKVR